MYRIREYKNSARLIYKKMEQVSSAAIGIWFNVGSRHEDAKINGISHFLEHLVFKGSKNYTGDEIKESIEGIGGSLNAFTSEENTCYYAKFLSKHLKKVGRVLSDMVLLPLIKPEDVEKERTVIIEEIKMYKDLPQYQVQELFDAMMWPAHPLGRNIAGSQETVSGISRQEIVDYHKSWYGSPSIVVSCVGNLEEKILEDFVQDVFGGLKKGEAGTYLPFVGESTKPEVKVLCKDIEQTHINLGFPALPRFHKDRFILGLLHIILGGNMSSRLFNEVREKKGLAYEIGTHVKRLHDTGVFFVHAGIDNKNLIQAARVIFEEFRKISDAKVTADELRRAKDFYISQSVMALDDTLEHMLWLGDSLTNLGYLQTKEEMQKEIQKVTADDILRLSRQIIDWKKLYFAVVGPQKSEAEKEIRGLLPV